MKRKQKREEIKEKEKDEKYGEERGYLKTSEGK